jgi:hypothetical protein
MANKKEKELGFAKVNTLAQFADPKIRSMYLAYRFRR